MPRPRYPSDDQRLRTKPHVRVHSSIVTHPRTVALWQDLEQRAVLIGLWMVARRAGAGFTDDKVTLGRAQLAEITAVPRLNYARNRLATVCEAMGYRYWFNGGTTTVEIRNFARKQGVRSTDRGGSATLEQEREREREQEESAPQNSRSKAPRKMVTSPEAIDFAERFRKALKGRTPDAKMPSDSAFARWIEAADRMYRIDKRMPAEAIELATWLFSDPGDQASFWRANCRAVPKFRTRFEELREHKARGERRGEKRDDRADTGAAAAERIARERGIVTGGHEGPTVDVRGDAGRLPASEEPRGEDDH